MIKPYETDDPPDPASELALAEIGLSLAGDLFRAELASADTVDLKAVGLAAADVPALALVVTFHGSVTWWWLSTAFLVSSGICFFLVVRQRRWVLGTEPKDFWNENFGKTRQVMLESALASTERNRERIEPFLESKGVWFRWGYRLLALGLLALLITTFWHIYR